MHRTPVAQGKKTQNDKHQTTGVQCKSKVRKAHGALRSALRLGSLTPPWGGIGRNWTRKKRRTFRAAGKCTGKWGG